jgi:hypothetical protein
MSLPRFMAYGGLDLLVFKLKLNCTTYWCNEMFMGHRFIAPPSTAVSTRSVVLEENGAATKERLKALRYTLMNLKPFVIIFSRIPNISLLFFNDG